VKIWLSRLFRHWEWFWWDVGKASAELIAETPEELKLVEQKTDEAAAAYFNQPHIVHLRAHRLANAIEEILKLDDDMPLRREAARRLTEINNPERKSP
jgi:hypothetical protein